MCSCLLRMSSAPASTLHLHCLVCDAEGGVSTQEHISMLCIHAATAVCI